MYKKYKSLALISLILLITTFSLNYKIVSADSGWDSSYDSSSSSWDSDTSWSSGSSWSGGMSYTSGDLEDGGPFVTIFTIIVIIIILSVATKINHSHKSVSSTIKYIGLTDEEIKQKDATLEKEILKEQAFNIYKEVQIAWMNFDYNSLRKNLTDEIYNMYMSQLKTLKIKNQQNIMKDIILNKIEIMEINIDNGIEEIKVYLNVSQYDYVIDKTNKVLRGTDKYKNNVEYMITLVRHIEDKKLGKCPNCGAPIDIISGGICPYCDSTIINNNIEFIMSKKECVGQWREK